MSKSWPTVPLWTASTDVRSVIDPDRIDGDVFHYSIPAVDETGTGLIEPASSLDSAKLQLQGGEVLISKLNPRKGRVLVCRPHTLPLVASPEFIALRVADSLLDRYLQYILRSEITRQYLDSHVQSATRSHQRVTPELVRHMNVALPSVEEQHVLADFLDSETARTDLAIENSREQCRLLDERFMESVRIATTGTSGPRRITGVEWMPSIHADWVLRKVSREFKTSSGTTPDSREGRFFDGPYAWVNSSDLLDGDVEDVERSVTQEALDAYSALRIQPQGSLIIAMYGQGETKGRTGLLRINACLNQACCALIPIGCISAEFAQYWFRAHRRGVVSLAYGAGQPNLSQELIRQLMVPDPGSLQQGEIVRELRMQESELRRQLACFTGRCSLLSERRQALITAAVTGQIDVTTARGVDL